MILPVALIGPLRALNAALDDLGTDLRAILDVRCDDLSAVVSSFLGLVMTLRSDEVRVTLTAIDPDVAVTAGTSLQLPLTSPTGVEPPAAELRRLAAENLRSVPGAARQVLDTTNAPLGQGQPDFLPALFDGYGGPRDGNQGW